VLLHNVLSLALDIKMAAAATRLCQAQCQFIKDARDSIKQHGAGFFHDKDWRDIKLVSGARSSLAAKAKLHTDSFCVRSLACWVPHLLFPNCLPKCPKCGSNKDINLGESRWADHPIMLHGTATHRHLDTTCCHCDNCKSKFAGHDKKAMQSNADQHVGHFNFHLGERGCAVDKELCSCAIHEATSEATAAIHERLHSMAVDNCVNNCHKCLHAVGAYKVNFSKRGKVTAHDTQQSTLDHHFVVTGSHSFPIRTSVSDLRDEIRNLKHKVEHANSVFNGDIQLSEIVELKRNNNCAHPPLKGIGESKLKQLLAAGCRTMRELVDFDPREFKVANACAKLQRWKRIAQCDLQKRTKEKERLEAALAAREEDLILELVVQDAQIDPLGNNNDMDVGDANETPEELNEPGNALPPLLSKMNDPNGCDARVMSKCRVDNTVTSEFQL